MVGDAVAIFKEEGVQVDHKILEHADPAESITREAERGGYDLVVVGYGGEEDKDAHLGSVAKESSALCQDFCSHRERKKTDIKDTSSCRQLLALKEGCPLCCSFGKQIGC